MWPWRRISMTRFLSTPSARRATEDDESLRKRVQEFLSTPSARRATGSGCEQSQKQCYFYPRPPRGGRQPFVTLPCCSFGISIHALREEGDRLVLFYYRPDWKFLSTPSARRATIYFPRFHYTTFNFYPRPPRGGRQCAAQVLHSSQWISIHALREEGDSFASSKLPLRSSFLSTPSARRATSRQRMPSASWQFLSTPSARRAT